MKPFMKVVFAYVNATAAVKDKVGRDDLEDDGIEGMITDLYRCNCNGCVHNPTNATSATERYIPRGVHLFTRQNRIIHVSLDVIGD